MDVRPIMVVFDPDGYIVLAAQPRKLTSQESREYMQPGWQVKTMPFHEYKKANYKWIYDKANEYQLAIEAIDACVKNYKVKIEITRKAYTNHYVAQDSGKWVIKVMGKRFADKDFVKAAGDAVTLVYNAHKKTNQ